MKINKENISEDNKELALNILNNLRSGNRVIGSPAEGLKKTLKDLETKRDNKSFSKTDWLMKDGELEENIAKLKKGIKGEEELSEYLSTILKYDDELDGVIAFASLSSEQENNNLDYIPDSDFLLVYGNNVLVIDAKAISTKPEQIIYLEEGIIVTESGKELLEVHGSTHIWKKLLPNLTSIDGYVCIVNKTGASIDKNHEWYSCDYKLIHISELRDVIKEWRNECTDTTCRLSTLVEIAKTQVKKEHSGLDLSQMKQVFRV